MARSRSSKQLSLPRTSGWGGRRAGAGRKPSVGRRSTPHRARPLHASRHPVHVTMRAVSGLARLRSDLAFGVVIRGIRAAQRADFRVVHYSVQRDHVHLVVEAASAGALSSGMRGLAIRVARRLNVALRRRGKVWGDRWHGRALRSPREVRNALVYVLMNARKHGELPLGLDGCASIYWAADCFGDALYRDGLAQLGRTRAPPVAPPHTWLLAKGWRRLGLLRATDAPRAAAKP